MEPNVDSGKKFGVYVALAFLASVVCAVIISWFLDLLELVPFTMSLLLIMSNNAIMAIVLGPILLLALYPQVKRRGLLWTQIMNPEEVSGSGLQKVGNVLVWIGGLGAAAVGLIISFSGELQGLGVGLGLIPFLVLIVAGSFMLGGREQVEAAEELMAVEEEESRA